MNPSTASHQLLGVLERAGIDRVFLVPGESYLAVLDALYDFPQLDVVTCRHEAGAGFMAIADGRLTGRPGVVMASRGPGASNAAIAIHAAQQDAVPLIVIVGQVPKRDLRREAFQEIDYQKMYGSIAKWVFEATQPEQLPEAAFKAVRIATSGTPGPVVLVLPEDVQQQAVATREWSAPSPRPTLPDPATLGQLEAMLRRAQRPLLIPGGAFERPGGREALLAFAEAWSLPVVVSFRRNDAFPNRHRLYAGELGLANPDAQLAAFRRSDLVLALGTRFGDITSQGYTLLDLPRPNQPFVHCYPDEHVVGLHFVPDLPLVCDPLALLGALTPDRMELHPAERETWRLELRALYEARAAWPERSPVDGVDFARVVRSVYEQATEDLVVCVDAGTFAAPVYRHFAFQPPQRLMAPICGAMGYGVPAAVATQLRYPGRRVVCMAGDGGFMMTGNEAMLAVERRLPILFIVSNNASYASIRIHQERDYPGRTVGTALFNPDFVGLAQAFGMPARRVSDAGEIDAAVREGLAGSGPCLLEVATSLQAVLPGRA